MKLCAPISAADIAACQFTQRSALIFCLCFAASRTTCSSAVGTFGRQVTDTGTTLGLLAQAWFVPECLHSRWSLGQKNSERGQKLQTIHLHLRDVAISFNKLITTNGQVYFYFFLAAYSKQTTVLGSRYNCKSESLTGEIWCSARYAIKEIP